MSLILKIMNNYKTQRTPLIMINIGKSKYIINTPECSQRFLKENGIKLSEGTKILISGNSSKYIGGLFGIMLNFLIRDNSKDTLIFCPENIFDFISDSKFVFGTKFLNFAICALPASKNNPIFKNHTGVLKKFLMSENCLMNSVDFFNWEDYVQKNSKFKKNFINAFEFLKSKSNYIDEDVFQKFDLYCIEDKDCEIIPICNKNKNGEINFSYLFIIHNQKNKIDPKKIVEFELDRYDMKNMMKEKQIEKNGKIILLEDILLKMGPNKAILFLDVQDENYIDSVINNKFLNYIIKNKTDIYALNTIIHLYDKTIYDDKNFQEFILQFTDIKYENIFAHANFDLEFDLNSEKIQNKTKIYFELMNKNFPYFFPQKSLSLFKNIESLQLFKNKIFQKNFFNIEFKRQEKTQSNMVVCNKEKTLYKNNLQTLFNPSEDKSYQKYKSLITSENNLKSPFIIFLGTGSMIPSTHRNVSSIMVGINNDCFLLLDCGEGTYHQLVMQFGDLVEDILFKIKIVTVSHLHGDHFFGIYNLISERNRVLKKRGVTDDLVICIPGNSFQMVKSFTDNLDSQNHYVVTNQSLVEIFRPDDENLKMEKTGEHAKIKKYLNYINYEYPKYKKIYKNSFTAEKKQNFLNLIKKHKIREILPVPVTHCPEAVGFVLQLHKKKIVYSGDCVLTPKLALYGKGADLLIHESTFDCSTSKKEVLAKGHSSIEDALLMAKMMECGFLAMTHFSQRYNFSSVEKSVKIKLPTDEGLLEVLKHRGFFVKDNLAFDFESLKVMPMVHNLFNKFIFY